MGGIAAWHFIIAAVVILVLIVVGVLIYIAKRGIPKGIARRVASRGNAKRTH